MEARRGPPRRRTAPSRCARGVRAHTDEESELALEAEPGGYVVTAAAADPERQPAGREHYEDYECDPERVHVARGDHARPTLGCYPPGKDPQ